MNWMRFVGALAVLAVTAVPLSAQVQTGSILGQNTGANSQLSDRPHQFKLTGTYVLPFYEIGLAGNFSSSSGILVTRQVATTLSIGGTTNVNVEEPGLHRLPTRTVMDLRIFKNITFGTRSLDLAIDFNNIANVNTVWNGRSLSGTIGLRQNGDPNGVLNTVPQFLSPAEVYGPRSIRFKVAYRF